MSTTKEVSVVLMGCGLVGKAVLRMINRVNAAAVPNVTFTVKAVAESDALIACSTGLDIESVLKHIEASGRLMTYKSKGVTVLPVPDSLADDGQLVDVVDAAKSILVDCTAASSTISQLKTWVAAGGAVTLANKKPLTGPGDDFDFLVGANGESCGYESTVGAGTPFVAAVRRLVAVNDTVHRVMGAMSGTLGFLMAGLQKGEQPWGALVNSAHELGYTEPDPRDDLSGTDVARKALILARTLGWKFEMDQIKVEALFPPEMSQLSIPDFKKAVHTLDDAMQARRDAAAAKGCVLRYVASCSADALTVGVQEVSADSPLGLLSGPANMLVVTSALYHDSPLVVQGAGAGDDVTAAGVVADMVQLALSARLA